MSDLTASNCGCNNTNSLSDNGCSWIWILILLSCCGGCGNGLFGNSGCGCNDNNGCSNWIWLLILLSFCGGWGNGNCGC
ncbi:MAG: chorion class high-cysteine HCB protein 13 [Roseburia sp.]|nr:chorion class high-cysteine HCB protein 13 [Roseburia sp.]